MVMNKNSMDSISDLFAFCEIVASGSFVRAAGRLNMTPSGVSKKLSRFEERLNVRLLNRTTRTLALTEAGRDLYTRGQSILSSIEEAEARAKHVSLTPRGRLRVACSDAFAVHVLAPMLRRFQARYPEVSITLIQGDGPIDMIEEEVDVAIRFERPTNAAFVAKRLIQDPWVVCASPAYLEQFGTPELPADLTAHRCLTIHRRGKSEDRWSFSIGGVEEEVHVSGWFSSIGLVVKAAVMEGLGIARLATFLVKKEIEAGNLIPVLSDMLLDDQRAIYAVYPHREYLPVKVRVFIDELEKVVSVSDLA
ncbi:MAG: DNA-binding transcriptional LysR family regulator [Candidatus Azotimanducaceae bacterium]|jgi:DNA-binding transcriptional LysR family regulator